MRILPLLFLWCLTACAASGPGFNEAMLPKDDGATLIIYRNDWYKGPSLNWWDIDINGINECSLHPNRFFIKHALPGRLNIASSMAGEPGTSRISLDIKSTETKYIRMEADANKIGATLLGGMAGRLIAEGVSETGGPFIFTNVDYEQARKDLRDLRQDCLHGA